MFLYIAVFIGGMTTLAVELSASRLLGYVFGTSNLIWANVIGLMLLFLTIGYFIGGRWADRSPRYVTFYRIFIWGAFLSALIPLAARPILSAAASAVAGVEAGLAIGSFVSVILLFSIPVTLLGCISPFSVRLAMQSVGESGQVAGQLYATSTLGSLLGTFLPTLVIIPQLGTFLTFILFASIMYLVGLVGLWSQTGIRALLWLWMPMVIALLAVLTLSGPLRAAAQNSTILFETESAYNYIQVQEDGNGFRELYLNDGLGVHSIWKQDQYLFGGTWDFFLTAPYFNAAPFTPDQVESLLVIGLATGTIPRQYIHVYGDIPIDGIEIDPVIIEAGARFFDMNEELMPSLTAYAQDGRYILNELPCCYTVIGLDAYRPPYIPWHLTTVEFFQEVRAHLAETGVVVVNVGRTQTDRRFIDAMTQTMLQVFPSIHAMDVPASFNTILVATVQPTTQENLAANLAALPPDAAPALREILTFGVANLVTTGTSDILFTDDRAPVETLVDAMVIQFLLEGNTSQLQVGDE